MEKIELFIKETTLEFEKISEAANFAICFFLCSFKADICKSISAISFSIYSRLCESVISFKVNVTASPFFLRTLHLTLPHLLDQC